MLVQTSDSIITQYIQHSLFFHRLTGKIFLALFNQIEGWKKITPEISFYSPSPLTLLYHRNLLIRKHWAHEKNMSSSTWNRLHHFQQKKTKKPEWPDPSTKIQLTNTNIPSADCRSQHNPSTATATATAGAVHQKPPNSLNYHIFYINYSSPGLAQSILSFLYLFILFISFVLLSFLLFLREKNPSFGFAFIFCSYGNELDVLWWEEKGIKIKSRKSTRKMSLVLGKMGRLQVLQWTTIIPVKVCSFLHLLYLY